MIVWFKGKALCADDVLPMMISWMSSLTSWISLVSLMSVCVNMSFYELYSFKVSFLESFSSSLMWLTEGVILVSFLASEKSKYSVFLWWGLSSVLMFGFTSLSLLKFYVMFELSLVPILMMIILMGSQPERLSAGMYLLFYTTTISIPYLGIIILMETENTLFWTNSSMLGATAVSILLLAPFLVKMPVFGLHFWLPKAHVEANTSGSMVLAGLLLKLGSYGVFRVFLVVLPNKSLVWYLPVWAILSVLSGICTYMQTDLKKLVAYSSVTHMTFLMIALACGSKVMLISALITSLSHGWAASGMFYMSGTLSHVSGSRSIHLLTTESGLNWFMLMLGILLTSNASVPPFPSFFSEVMMMTNFLSSSIAMVFLFIFLSVSVCYYNAFAFIMITHFKPVSILTGLKKYMYSLCVLFLVSSSVVTLFWMNLY